jgi:hypothetical protein
MLSGSVEPAAPVVADLRARDRLSVLMRSIECTVVCSV